MTAFSADATQQDKRIINKLRVTSQVPFLNDAQFNIKVYDITEPLTNLFKAATQGPPQTTTDVETGKSTVANKPITVTFDRGQPVDSVFDFVYNVASHEIGIKLKSDFSGTGRTAVYKVDIVLGSSTIKDFAESDQVMLLNYGGGYQIHSLAESIKFAVRDVAASMNGKVLYTFYIKIDG